jgi:hypothetical protein
VTSFHTNNPRKIRSSHHPCNLHVSSYLLTGIRRTNTSFSGIFHPNRDSRVRHVAGPDFKGSEHLKRVPPGRVLPPSFSALFTELSASEAGFDRSRKGPPDGGQPVESRTRSARPCRAFAFGGWEHCLRAFSNGFVVRLTGRRPFLGQSDHVLGGVLFDRWTPRMSERMPGDSRHFFEEGNRSGSVWGRKRLAM